MKIEPTYYIFQATFLAFKGLLGKAAHQQSTFPMPSAGAVLRGTKPSTMAKNASSRC